MQINGTKQNDLTADGRPNGETAAVSWPTADSKIEMVSGSFDPVSSLPDQSTGSGGAEIPFFTSDELAKIQLDQIRPTLAVFLGGTGQVTGTEFKALLIQRFGDDWKNKIRLLAFDTTEEPVSSQVDQKTINLEPGGEFFNIGHVPVPNIIENIDNLTAIQERLGSSITNNNFSASVMRSGAKQQRPLGLLALLWHYPKVFEQLRKAVWHLAGRDMAGANTAAQQQGINVFICGSLVGGTGSGMMIDIAYLIKSLFDELGSQGEFCHISGIGLLPQAFHGVPGARIRPNTYAILKELNHVMVKGDFHARYPDGRMISTRQSPFHLFYVLDGVDERGQTWSSITDVMAMAAEGIFLQMASQLGCKGDNAFDNVDESLAGVTDSGYGTYLASFGIGTLEFPAPKVTRYFAQRYLIQLINTEWNNNQIDTPDLNDLTNLLSPIAPAQVEQILKKGPNGNELRVDLRLPVWLNTLKHSEVLAQATTFVRDYGNVRVTDELLTQLQKNSQQLALALRSQWETWCNDQLLAPGNSIFAQLYQMEQARKQFQDWSRSGSRSQTELKDKVLRAETALTHAERSLEQATSSLPIGRSGRIQRAVAQLFAAAQELYEAQVEEAITKQQIGLWNTLESFLSQTSSELNHFSARLHHVARQTTQFATETLHQCQAGGVSRLSLADESYLNDLYVRFLPEKVTLFDSQHIRDQGIRLPLELLDYPLDRLRDLLIHALQEQFEAVNNMTVEQVIDDRSAEMTPRARREQLFRLATPSWSLDRARLPDGGATLIRLEVLGVPDENRTHFLEEMMRVSTQDPHRLIALVVVAGAPQDALQQYKMFEAAYKKSRKSRPLHILPRFLSDGNQSRLSFALGSIFRLIYSQGTYFYYQPKDSLQPPIKLGNGLANAIQTLTGHEDLVAEIMERIDGHIAQHGLQQTITVLTDYVDSNVVGKTSLDELSRELKRLVRAYADELRHISEFNQDLV